MSGARPAAVLGAALCALLAVPASAQGRVAFADLQLHGPLEDVRLDAGRAGETLLQGRLAAGESLSLVAPIPELPGGARREPAWPAGVRSTGWSAADPRFAALPAALRARALPAPPEERVRAGPAVLALLAAAFVGALALRARPALALLVGLASALAGGALAARGAGRAAGTVEVLDGVDGCETWLRVRGARGALEVPARSTAFELRTEPPAAAIVLRVPLDAGRPASAEARGGRIFAAQVEPWPAGALALERNDLAPLAAVWLREAGEWTARGPWGLGDPLPGPVPGPPPPGWLVSGLPQGVRVLVGLEAARADGSAWVRCTYP